MKSLIYISLWTLVFLPELVYGQLGEYLSCSKRVDYLVQSHPNYGKSKYSSQAWLTKEQFNELNACELLYYSLQYPESYSQVCYRYGYDMDRIFPRLDIDWSGLSMSSRQMDSLRAKEDSIRYYILQVLDAGCVPDHDLMRAIARVSAWETIPALVNAHNNSGPQYKRKHNDVLSCLISLMRYGKDPEFIHSPLYKAFFGEDDFFGTPIPYTEEAEAQILKLSMNYYQRKKNEHN